MRFLLDTHVLLWLLAGSVRLPEDIRDRLADPRHALFVSAASGWEIAIKLRLGKLNITPAVHQWLPDELDAAGILELPVTLAHTLAVEQLPRHHGDPFDRLLIAQANIEQLMLVSADQVFGHDEVRLLRI